MTTRLNPHKTRLEDLESSGIRANGNQKFNLELIGYEIHDMLNVFEDIASKDGPYIEVSKAVLCAETLRDRANKAGYSRRTHNGSQEPE